MVGSAQLLIVVVTVVTYSDAAVCTFENRPDPTQKRYSAVVQGKVVYGSPSQEHDIFFEPEPAMFLSFACFVGLFWAVSAAAVTIMLTKTIPQFGWKANKPNLCGGLIVLGSFFLGVDNLQELCLMLFTFDNDLAYYKADRVDIFDELGWICYFWALDCFTALWVDIARRAGCSWCSKTIRWSVGFLSISGTAIMFAGLVNSLALLTSDSQADLSTVNTDSRRFDAMPKWHVDASRTIWLIASLWMIVAIIINTVSAVLMKMAVSKKDFGEGDTFVKITLINFYQQMVFNVAFAGFIICNFVVIGTDVTARDLRLPALWLVCIMALSWGAEFVVIFAYTVDQKNASAVTQAEPLDMFGASPSCSI